MRAVKSKDTAPELRVRRFVHRLGYRFRLHRKDLPGVPDIVFPRLKRVIFVNGCFWHGHECIRGGRIPKTNRPYWEDKVSRNRARDLQHTVRLEELGWKAHIVWECELNNTPDSAERAILAFLST